jgi:hypothetical protein
MRAARMPWLAAGLATLAVACGNEAGSDPRPGGAAGTTGSAGVSGTAGTTGSAGLSGSAGTTGTGGVTGAAGTTGAAGSATSGAAGATGTAGTTGSAGAIGAAGRTGAAGTTGASGAAGTGSNAQVDLGRPCDVGVSDAGSNSPFTFINSPASECGSRICLLSAAERNTDTGPLCTKSCESDLDCAAAQLGDPQSPDDHRCNTGFTCDVPVTTGPFCCLKMCVCKDFVAIPPGGRPVPPSCRSDASSCSNVP